jgi:hypothetical protein
MEIIIIFIILLMVLIFTTNENFLVCGENKIYVSNEVGKCACCRQDYNILSKTGGRCGKCILKTEKQQLNPENKKKYKDYTKNLSDGENKYECLDTQPTQGTDCNSETKNIPVTNAVANAGAKTVTNAVANAGAKTVTNTVAKSTKK